jgi:hypothetical protein
MKDLKSFTIIVPKKLTVFITFWYVGALVAAPGLPVGLRPLCLAVCPAGLPPTRLLAKLSVVEAGRGLCNRYRKKMKRLVFQTSASIDTEV